MPGFRLELIDSDEGNDDVYEVDRTGCILIIARLVIRLCGGIGNVGNVNIYRKKTY